MNRILYPILGLLILGATVVQVNATRRKPAPQRVDSIAEKPRVVAEGRVVTYPGAEVTIGSDVAGTISRLDVNEKETVRRTSFGKSGEAEIHGAATDVFSILNGEGEFVVVVPRVLGQQTAAGCEVRKRRGIC